MRWLGSKNNNNNICSQRLHGNHVSARNYFVSRVGKFDIESLAACDGVSVTKACRASFYNLPLAKAARASPCSARSRTCRDAFCFLGGANYNYGAERRENQCRQCACVCVAASCLILNCFSLNLRSLSLNGKNMSTHNKPAHTLCALYYMDLCFSRER